MEAHSLNADIWAMRNHVLQRLDNILRVVKVQQLKVWQLLLGKVQSVLLVVNHDDPLGTPNVCTLCSQNANCSKAAPVKVCSQAVSSNMFVWGGVGEPDMTQRTTWLEAQVHILND